MTESGGIAIVDKKLHEQLAKSIFEEILESGQLDLEPDCTWEYLDHSQRDPYLSAAYVVINSYLKDSSDTLRMLL